MSLTEKDVARFAKLARIELPQDKIEQSCTELNDLLHLIEKLQSVDTRGIEPMAHPLSGHQEVALRLRDDVVTEEASVARRDALTTNAPALSSGLFLVPKVVE